MGFATKFIRAGEEITDTYCPTYAAIGPTERGQSLAKYNFTCNCTPCSEEWPTLDQLPRKFHGLPLQCYRIDSKEKVSSLLKPKFSWKITSKWHRLHSFLTGWCFVSWTAKKLACQKTLKIMSVIVFYRKILVYYPTSMSIIDQLKLIYSEKATKFCEIFTLLLSYVVPIKSKVKISKILWSFQNI